MTAPLYVAGAFSYQTSLIVAVGIGFLFGFVLERAGFGDSRNLTSIFYFRDMRVLKVMFSAMVTAMIGLISLSWLGLFDYSVLVDYTLLKTYLWPQLVGGILFGLGFAIGGYCPGTAAVGVVSGKLDAVIYVLGMVMGIWVFAAGFPVWGDFYMSSGLGRLTLWEAFGLSKEVMALVITLMALAAFWLAGLGERWAPYDK
ncbi:MAG: YeeE/YedE family protein [Desulfomonile tiedjei]|uniref:YeeE/YedE family protein n=1 Tax=Desulfomonile tiedjei TaxID=2358 RepID=A0A9D6Z513_9BACT|nr:YeeE/YedE family protein [Desulfomonile tiedjei]